MRVLLSLGLLSLTASCTSALAPENQGASGANAVESNQSSNATEATDAGTADAADTADAGGDDSGATNEEVGSLGTIDSKTGTLVTKGFEPKSVYGSITALGANKSLTIFISEQPMDANQFRKVKEYTCTACVGDECDPEPTEEKYETIMVTLMDAQVMNPTTFQMEDVDAVDADGYPLNADYEKSKLTEMSVSVAYNNGDTGSPVMLTGGKPAGTKVIAFETKPTAAAKAFKMTVSANLVSPMSGATDFATPVEDVEVVVSGDIVEQPTQPAQPTCAEGEYPKPTYE